MQNSVMEGSHTARWLAGLHLSGIFLILVSLLMCYKTVYAQSIPAHPNFALQPATYNPAIPATKSYFILNTKAGATLSESIRVSNTGAVAGGVSIYPVGTTTAPTGGIAYLSKNDPRRDVASWIKLDKQQLILAPGQSQIVSFKLAIPASTHPGVHIGAITVENLTLQHSSGKGAFSINLQKLSIMAVQVNIPGPVLEQMKVTGIKAGGSNGYQNLLVSMANTGNQMVSPNGTLSIDDAQGRLLQVLSFKSGLILPDTGINYPVYLRKQALAAGNYQVSLVMNYGHGKILSYASKLTITQAEVNQAFANGPLQAPTSTIMPLWQIILLVLAALIVLFVGGQKVYGILIARRRKQPEGVV
jgi:hypothetical protein